MDKVHVRRDHLNKGIKYCIPLPDYLIDCKSEQDAHELLQAIKKHTDLQVFDEKTIDDIED